MFVYHHQGIIILFYIQQDENSDETKWFVITSELNDLNNDVVRFFVHS